MSEKIMFAHPQSTSLLALINRSIHIYLRKYVRIGQKCRNQIYILSETFLVKPKLHTTTGRGYHTGHFGQVNKKLQILRAENFNIQFKLLTKNQ